MRKQLLVSPACLALLLVAAVLAAGPIPGANAQPFSFGQNNVVVVRFGGDANFGPGGAALGSAATAQFIDQFLPNVGAQPLPVNTAGANLSIALPTVVGTSGNPLASTVSGSATSEGQFTRSADGLSFVVPGYNAAVGTATVATSSPGTNNRSISLISAGALNSTNGFSDGPSGNFRSAASVSGADIYASTNAGMFLKNATGTVTTTTAILAAGNLRNVNIGNNSLFVSSASVTPGVGVSLVGSAGVLPTTATATTLLPGTGVSGTGTPSPYGFVLFDNPLNANNWNGTGFDTLYVADDRTVASGGGVQRWVFDGAVWGLTGTISSGAGSRGLAASLDTSTNTVTIFSTTAVASANSLFTVADSLSGTGGTFGSILTLATAPVNTAFRGVDFTPVPEPSTVLAIAAAGLGVGSLVRRRFNQRRIASV